MKLCDVYKRPEESGGVGGWEGGGDHSWFWVELGWRNSWRSSALIPFHFNGQCTMASYIFEWYRKASCLKTAGLKLCLWSLKKVEMTS